VRGAFFRWIWLFVDGYDCIGCLIRGRFSAFLLYVGVLLHCCWLSLIEICLILVLDLFVGSGLCFCVDCFG